MRWCSPYAVLLAEVRDGFYREGAKDAKKTSKTWRSLCLGGEKSVQVCLATLFLRLIARWWPGIYNIFPE